MRLKSFTAASMAEAMRQIREVLGEDAIIVSSQPAEGGKGVRVTAALDQMEEEAGWGDAAARQPDPEDVLDIIAERLERHGVPGALADRLLRISATLRATDPILSLAGALDEQFRFAPLPEGEARRPFMLVGPPGAGKSVTTAKLATRAVLAKRPAMVATTDTLKAGGVEQLETLMRVLKLPLTRIERAGDLGAFVKTRRPGGLTLIDSAGVNPFSDADMGDLREMLRAADAEPVLVLPAGGDPQEAAEIAEAFRPLGVNRLVCTRLDMARRLGFVLTAAEAGSLKLANVSAAPGVAEGFAALNPVSLARLLLPDQIEARASTAQERVAG
ncbi:MAG: AAA family ATPase [Thalassobaculales bacterium]